MTSIAAVRESIIKNRCRVRAKSGVTASKIPMIQQMDFHPLCNEASTTTLDHVDANSTEPTSIQNAWAHYHHNDNLDSKRWSAKECHLYLEDRPWAGVLKFYSLVATGRLNLSDVIFSSRAKHTGSERSTFVNKSIPPVPVIAKDESQNLRGGKWDRKTYKVVISYDGSAFAGWQKQPGSLTVQGLLEQALGKFVDGKRASSLEAEGCPVEAAVSVAGRTDKGVHASGQVCSFYTWRTDIKLQDVESIVNMLMPEALKVVYLEEVSRTFHPNFSAKWRRYVYLLPLHNLEVKEGHVQGNHNTKESCAPAQFWIEDSDIGEKHWTFDVMAVNELLSQLEGKSVSCAIFARDTKTSRSSGSPTMCNIYHARAAIAELPSIEQSLEEERTKVMCVEIVANRFLRKMVRVLVATSVREAAAGAPSNTLFQLTRLTCRRASAPPAPTCGLCLAEVGYDDLCTSKLLIK